jgi:enamine deaminase RidA (YjgF/YER057c/UK114 family)
MKAPRFNDVRRLRVLPSIPVLSTLQIRSINKDAVCGDDRQPLISSTDSLKDHFMSRDERFNKEAEALGYSFDGEIRIGGNYVPLLRDGDHIYVSGQIPRIDNTVVVTGPAGTEASLAQAQVAAKVCVMRALALLKRSLGSLERIKAVPRITVYVQSAQSFTQQSEVADGASEVLYTVLGAAGAHTRTSVGVFQLPKNATVEIDLIATVE